MYRLVVLSILFAVTSGKPSASHFAAPIATYPAAAVVEKTVHYASQPVVAGYSSSVIKPNLGYSLATPVETVQQQSVLAPTRTVVDVQPEITVAHAPVLAKITENIHHVPTAVSHQSSTVIHSKAAVVTPVATKTIISVPAPIEYHSAPSASVAYAATPAFVSYASSPVIQKSIISGPTYAAPVTYAYSAPVLQKTFATAPAHIEYAAAPQYGKTVIAAPASYVYDSPAVKTVETW